MRAGVFASILLSLGMAGAFAQTTPTAPEYKIKTIVLDAGHGGHDIGCHGSVAYEKNVTLAIALKLGALIQQTYPDIKVIYTRSTDKFIELYERADIANRNNADLFVSIHCNANKNTTAYGTETWLMGLHKSEDNLEVSKRENDVILLEDNYIQNYDGFDPNSPEGYIILTMNQNAHLDQSIDLASLVEGEFVNDKRTSRGVKQAGFLVLWRTTMPAILIETGFLTNRTEEKYLNSVAGQSETAQSILDAITTYKQSVEIAATVVELPVKNLQVLTTDSLKVPITIQNNPQLEKKPDTIRAKPPAPGLIYKVQILALPTTLTTNDPKLKGVKDISTEKNEKGWVRYLAGNYTTMAAAAKRAEELRKLGFADAFVVGYREGKRVLQEELK